MWDEAVKEFIKPFAEGKPPFVLSNWLPHSWLPRPITDMDFEIEDIEMAKKWKKIKFIEDEDFNDYYSSWIYKQSHTFMKLVNKYAWRDPKLLLNDFESIELWKNTVNRNNLKAANYYQESKRDDWKNIDIYMKVFDSEFLDKYKLFDDKLLLKEVFEKNGFWKKRSSGYWKFVIEKFCLVDEFLFDWWKVLLSNCILSQDDFKNLDNYYYESFVKYPTYWENFSQNENFLKSPINFVKQWSTINTNFENEFIGKMLELKEWIYQYGFWFII